MIKFCDSKHLYCKEENKTQMRIAVNFNGKLHSYCCIKCADDDIQETSNGDDSMYRAVNDLDVFILSTDPRTDISK